MATKGTLKTCSRGHTFRKSSDCPVCPKCWAGYYKHTKHGNIPSGLGAPAIRALLNDGITSLAKLSKKTEKHVADLHGMGPKGIRILKAAMKEKDLSFKKEAS